MPGSGQPGASRARHAPHLSPGHGTIDTRLILPRAKPAPRSARIPDPPPLGRAWARSSWAEEGDLFTPSGDTSSVDALHCGGSRDAAVHSQPRPLGTLRTSPEAPRTRMWSDHTQGPPQPAGSAPDSYRLRRTTDPPASSAHLWAPGPGPAPTTAEGHVHRRAWPRTTRAKLSRSCPRHAMTRPEERRSCPLQQSRMAATSFIATDGDSDASKTRSSA